MQYWLMKSEPTSYSIDHLKRDKKTPWDGVRNYQARNFMRDEMAVGDKVLFYHSSTEVPGIAGEGSVCSAFYPDPTQFDAKSKYYDSKASNEKPRWFLVDVCFAKKYKEVIPLTRIKNDPRFSDMLVVQRGSRLSIQPVSKKHFDAIVKLAEHGR